MEAIVTLEGSKILVTRGTDATRYQKQGLPESFIQWQLRVKRGRVDREQSAGPAQPGGHPHGAQAQPSGHPGGERALDMAATMGAHIATFVTRDPTSAFSLTTASKGVLLLPRPEFMGEVLNRQRQILQLQYGAVIKGGEHQRPTKPQWDAAAPLRLQFLDYLYDRAKLDWSVLGVLEIFEGRTLKNIKREPECCFHFLGIVGPMGRGFQAYQINAIAQIIEESPELEYMRNMKLISEYYGSHVPQQQYRLGYLCHTCEVYDKNPFPEVAGKRLV